MNRKILIVKNRSELEKCFPVMKELRPHLTFADFISIYEDAHRNDGYEIVAIEDDNNILAIMGYRILSDYVRGKHVYIDDLVSSESVRSKGLGAELLRYAEGVARDLNLKTLRLCTGIENDRGVSFYERNGWIKRAFAYTKKL